MFRRIRSLVATLTVLALLLTFAPPRHARAEAGLTEPEAITLLRTYNIIRGDQNGSFNLDQKIDRASAATIFVRTMGAEELAKALKDTVPFPDAGGHWAAGEIAMSSNLGLMRGDGAGNFRPRAEITYVEVLTVLLRMVQREPAGAWNPSAIMAAANNLGMVPAGVQAFDPAIRGKIFWSMAVAVSQVQLPSGHTTLQKYLDAEPPVLTLDRTSFTTTVQTVTITGSAVGASRVVVGNNSATLDRNTGRFTYTGPAVIGTSSLEVQAFDFAGNMASASVSVVRQGNISRIDITGPPAVQLGSKTKLTVTATDSAGNQLGLDGVQVSLTGDVATFDLNTLTLTAGTKLGRGVLTLRAGTITKSYTFDVTGMSTLATQLKVVVNNGRAPALGKEATIKVQVLDQTDRLLTDDYFRPVTINLTGLNGVTVPVRTANTQAGVATFTVTGTVQGLATLTVTSAGLPTETAPVEFLPPVRIVLTPTVTSLSPDGTTVTSIRATIQDDLGNNITNNSTADIAVSLTAEETDGVLTDPLMTIRRSTATSSGDDATFQVGITPGTAKVTGRVTFGQQFPVQTLFVPVNNPLPGVKLQVTGPTTRQIPGGTAAPITIKVLNAQGTPVTTGSYAFQVAVTTSNNEPLVGGLPEGVELTFTNTPYRPVADNSGTAVIGRTYQGTATLSLTYNKSGIVTITPRLITPTQTGYHPTIGFGPAAGTTGVSTLVPASVTFAGNPARIQLTVDSPTGGMGLDLPGVGVTGVNTLKVRARIVDSSGTPIPGNGDAVTLTRTTAGNGISRLSDTTANYTRKNATNGVAEFSVLTTSTPGFDVYTATAGTLPAASVTLAVRSEKALTPNVTAIRGGKENGTSPTVGYVAPDDEYMEIQLNQQVPADPNEPTHWALVKVYRKGVSSSFYSEVVNLKELTPTIRIPKGKLLAGTAIYEVTVNTGAGDTSRSPDLGLSTAVNAVYESTYKLNSALFDAVTGKLVISTSGLVTGGQVLPAKLSIVKGTNELNLGDPVVTVVSVSSTSLVLQLGSLAAAVSPDVYNGEVTIKAEDGWFTSPDGSHIARGSNTAQIQPLATIQRAELEASTRKLTLFGSGFLQGTFTQTSIQVKQGAQAVPLKTTDIVASKTDTQIVIALTQASLDAINALMGADTHVAADVGWLKKTSGTLTYNAPAAGGISTPLQVKVSVTRAGYDRPTNTLTIWGSGYTGAVLDPAKLRFRAYGTTRDWRPTEVATVTVVNDSTITITWSDTDATAFESSAWFSGRSVFLNTDPGWLIDAAQRSAAPLPTNNVTFTVLAQ